MRGIPPGRARLLFCQRALHPEIHLRRDQQAHQRAKGRGIRANQPTPCWIGPAFQSHGSDKEQQISQTGLLAAIESDAEASVGLLSTTNRENFDRAIELSS